MNKILVVEDEKEIRENIVEILEIDDYEVHEAANTLAALEIFNTINPDLIISDIMMPGLDGMQLLDEIQNRSSHDIPFIFLTAKSSREDVRQAMNKGANDYITKPFTSEELLSAVEAKIAKQKQVDDRIKNLVTNITNYVPHELRTPLVSILGYSDIIMDSDEQLSREEILDIVETIKRSGERLSKRIEKFLLYSEVVTIHDELSKEKYARQITNINSTDLIEKVKSKLESVCSENELIVDMAETTLKISEYFLKIVLTELLENACKFSEFGSNIEIIGRKDKDYYNLSVKDYGRGMTSNEIKSINAFVQFDRTKYQQIGNGLGLIIVKKIIEIVNGEFFIESKKNEYTVVRIQIPIVF